MTIALSLILIGSIICSVKFFLETEKVLSEQPQSKSVSNKNIGHGPIVNLSPKDGGKLVILFFLTWVVSVVFIGLGIFVVPTLIALLVLTPYIINLIVKKYVINDQVICLGASLMALGIVLSIFLLIF
jgi:hypothetical protein